MCVLRYKTVKGNKLGIRKLVNCRGGVMAKW